MQRPILRVFGERNTGSRAVISMLEAAGFACSGEAAGFDAPPRERALQRRIESAFDGPWKHVYLDALRDIRAQARGPLGQWKHAAPRYDRTFREARARVLFLTRNPYSWAVALHRNPYHQRGPRQRTLDGFLSTPWATLGREQMAPVVPGPAHLWRWKMQAALDFEELARGDGVAVGWLSFETFVADPVHALTRALARMGVVAPQLVLVPNTKPDGRSAADIAEYYAGEAWKDALDPDAVWRINDQIPADLMDGFGYARLRPEDFGRRAA